MGSVSPISQGRRDIELTEDTTADYPVYTEKKSQKEVDDNSDEMLRRSTNYGQLTVHQEDEPVLTSKKQISLEALYPGKEEHSSLIFWSAIKNLQKAIGYLTDAINAEKIREHMSADDAILHFTQLLPKLFCSRSLGDGFGIIVNSIMIAIENRKGDPLEPEQILAIKRCVEKLKRQPFLAAEEAIKEVISLEEKGLNTDLAELSFVADSS